jgi:hypothetical protein
VLDDELSQQPPVQNELSLSHYFDFIFFQHLPFRSNLLVFFYVISSFSIHSSLPFVCISSQ